MTDSASFFLAHFLEFPDREVRYEMHPVVELTQADFESIRTRYLRLSRGNHPPMAELLDDIVGLNRRRLPQYAKAWRAARPPPGLPKAIRTECQVAAFAAANAVYSFQEHAKVESHRRGGEALWATVNASFAEVYDARWRYLLVYQLRRIFTHVSIQAADLVVRSRVDAEGTPPSFDLALRLSRSAVIRSVGPKVRHALDELDDDPDLADVLEEASDGVWEVHHRIRSLINPETTDDLSALDPWRRLFLDHGNPVNLTAVGADGTLSMTRILPEELLAAGMDPLPD